jgi:hypothetical protein
VDIHERQMEANILRQQVETLRILTEEIGFDDEPALRAVIDSNLSELLEDS